MLSFSCFVHRIVTLTKTSPLVTLRSWRTVTGSRKTAPASHTLTGNRWSPLGWWVTHLPFTGKLFQTLNLESLDAKFSVRSVLSCRPSFPWSTWLDTWWLNALIRTPSSSTLPPVSKPVLVITINKPLDQRAPQRLSSNGTGTPSSFSSPFLVTCIWRRQASSLHLFLWTLILRIYQFGASMLLGSLPLSWRDYIIIKNTQVGNSQSVCLCDASK